MKQRTQEAADQISDRAKQPDAVNPDAGNANGIIYIPGNVVPGEESGGFIPLPPK